MGGLSRSRKGGRSMERSPETSVSGGIHSLGVVLALVPRRAIASLVGPSTNLIKITKAFDLVGRTTQSIYDIDIYMRSCCASRQQPCSI